VLWLTPVIPITQETEIRRIMIRGHPEQTVSKTSSQQINWIWYFKSVILAVREAQLGRLWFKFNLGNNMRSYLENKYKQKGQGSRLKW
jgi:hypothetical protein